MKIDGILNGLWILSFFQDAVETIPRNGVVLKDFQESVLELLLNFLLHSAGVKGDGSLKFWTAFRHVSFNIILVYDIERILLDGLVTLE